MQPIKNHRRYALLTASRTHSIHFLLGLCLLTASISSCKKAADAQPDWASGVVGTYRGSHSSSSYYPTYTATVLVTRVDNNHVTLAYTIQPGTSYSEGNIIENVDMSSATALKATNTGFRKGYSTYVTGSFGGSSFILTLDTPGYCGTGKTCTNTFTGSK